MTDHCLPRATSLGVTEIFSGVRQLAANWLKRRRLHRLEELDDRMLNDIGIERGELVAALLLPLSVDPIYELNRRSQQRRVRGQRHR
jgi:uncharacterized protein YjiS (DUF1127 family)